MAATTETSDGPVMSFMNKRLRALKKKYNRILQLEDSISQGKTLNKDQEEVLRAKPSVLTLIDEYEKLRHPLAAAVHEELNLNLNPNLNPSPAEADPQPPAVSAAAAAAEPEESKLEDLLKLLYFGLLFDVKPQSEFTNIMFTRTHERECCLTYDYVTDEATDLLGEKDFDLISMLGGLVVSRPPHSGLSHKNALRSCVERAKLWLANSDKPIEDGVDVTYAALRERLDKIVASDYFIRTPEMKDPVDVAAAAGKYVPVQGSSVSSEVTVHTESDFTHYEQKEEEHSEGQEEGTDLSSPVEEPPKESEIPNSVDDSSVQQEKSETDVDEQNLREVDTKNQQYIPRRDYQNNRGNRGGGGGGRRGYPNSRGARSTRGGGGYQNGRGQYYDHPGNYYPRNYHNTRGRAAGGNAYNNHGYARGKGAQADEVHA